MDPLTQGVIGGVASQLVTSPRDKLAAGVLGFLSGMAADLDVLIRSDTDHLLALEYHRQFTHSLVFIPLGALLCAVLFYALLFRRRMPFKRTYLFCLIGYATHALLDACTTYGTQLLWPFSNARIAWNNVSVVDPLFTIPLLVILLLALSRGSKRWAWLGAIYAFSYLGLGVLQNHRAHAVAERLAAERGHQAINLGVKPSFANIVVWKSVYQHEGLYYIDAIRVLGDHKVFEGTSVEMLDLNRHFSWLDDASQQAKDIQRFSWFSNQHLGIDPDNHNRIIDIRYSLIPNRVDGMWGITLKQDAAPDEFAQWSTSRPKGAAMRRNVVLLWSMIKS